jgi:hypothetical protein
MALPANLSTATVTGTYVDLSGNPVRGSISFTPQTILKDTTLNVIVIPVIIVKEFDANGSFTVTLPCTDDTDVAPQPFVYTLEENFGGGRNFSIALPLSVANTTLNLADLLPALSTAESASFVSLAQSTALNARRVTAEGIRTIVVDAEDYEGNAQVYANAAAVAAAEVAEFTTRSLLLMGV